MELNDTSSFSLAVILFYFCIYTHICELLERCAFPTGKIRRLNFIGEIRGITMQKYSNSQWNHRVNRLKRNKMTVDWIVYVVRSNVLLPVCVHHSLYSTCKNKIREIKIVLRYSSSIEEESFTERNLDSIRGNLFFFHKFLLFKQRE